MFLGLQTFYLHLEARLLDDSRDNGVHESLITSSHASRLSFFALALTILSQNKAGWAPD
jgi:hypothetical protein